MSQLTDSPAWKALARHAESQRAVSLLDLFAKDPLRAERLSCEAAGLYLDYSKQRASRETLDLLVRLAEARGVPRAIQRMFGGEQVNPVDWWSVQWLQDRVLRKIMAAQGSAP